MKIAFLLYPTAQVKNNEDSSFWIIHELLRRGHKVFTFESRHLLDGNRGPSAFLSPAKTDLKKGYLPAPSGSAATPLMDLDCIFIRKEPPFEAQYLYALQALNRIKKHVFILNDPAGIALSNEKSFVLDFPDWAPDSVVTENFNVARKFMEGLHSKAVIKPLHQKGGVGIFMANAKDGDLPSLFEMATHGGKQKVMVQRYVQATPYEDKRILILNGHALGAFTRRPSKKDFRANLSVGGTMHRSQITRHEEALVEVMAPVLRERGLYFVGIDMIGRFLTEINVTSPAGIPEINGFDGKKLEKEVADFIEAGTSR